MVANDLPGNACLSFCVVSVLSSCGFVFSIIIGIIRDFFLLVCVWLDWLLVVLSYVVVDLL